MTISSDYRQYEEGDSVSSEKQWTVEAEKIAGIGFWSFCPEDEQEQWSFGLKALLDIPPDGRTLKLFEYIPTARREFFHFLNTNHSFFRRQCMLRCVDRTRIFLFQAEKKLDAQGRVSQVLGTLQDISDLAWEIGRSDIFEQLFESFVSSDRVLIAAFDRNRHVTCIEGDGWKHLSLDPRLWVGKSMDEVLGDYPDLIDFLSEALHGESRSIYCTAKERDYLVRVRPHFGPKGTVAGIIAFAVDTTDLDQDREKGRKSAGLFKKSPRRGCGGFEFSESTLNTILAASNAGIAVIRADRTVSYANEAACRLVGLDSLPEGATVERFLKPKILRKLREVRKRREEMPDTEDHFRRQVPLQAKDGSTVWADVLGVFNWDGPDRMARLTVVMFDITHQRRVMDDLREAKIASEAASVAKSRFLAHMSHEIRTPLNGVIGLSDLLMGTSLTAKQAEYVGLINISGKSLLFLINDILDFSKIEAGKMEIEDEEFDLLTTVESVLGILATRASDKGLELCGSFASELPRFVSGDSGRLRQVLINLVGNALKFTDNGGVKVKVSVAKTCLSPTPCDSEEMTDEVLVRFSVIDTGIGISPKGVSKLFRSFTQIDSSASKRHDGTGLGLAISKRLVELMNGKLSVESVEGEGSVFWFDLPLRCRVDIQRCPARYREDMPEDEHVPCPRSGEDRCPLGHRRILHGSVPLSDRSAIVVDDNEVQRDALAEQLSSWGMEVSKAASQEEALSQLRLAVEAGRHYQLAVIDNSIDNGDGMDLVEAMKADPTFAETAIILLTPLTVDTDIAVIHSSGIVSQVSKPVFSSSLFDATVTALFSKKKSQLQSEATRETDQDDFVEEGFDERRAMIRILVAEDNKVNQIVVRDTLENVGFQCEVVENGLLAAEAVATGRFDAVLMDCQMPEMDGFEATARIRLTETDDLHAGRIARRVPIIALTANATREDETQCLRIGMDAYCSKPINPKTLVRTLDHWVHSIIKDRLELRSDEPVAPFSIKTFLVLCGKNRLIATMVLSDFLNQAPCDLERIETALRQADWEQAAERLQHLRGKAGLLGAVQLEANVFDLEERCLAGEGDDYQNLFRLIGDEAHRTMQYAEYAKQRIIEGAITLH